MDRIYELELEASDPKNLEKEAKLALKK